MEDKHSGRKGFDYQERWHGFGSPVGLGIGLVSVGLFSALLGLAYHLFKH